MAAAKEPTSSVIKLVVRFVSASRVRSSATNPSFVAETVLRVSIVSWDSACGVAVRTGNPAASGVAVTKELHVVSAQMVSLLAQALVELAVRTVEAAIPAARAVLTVRKTVVVLPIKPAVLVLVASLNVAAHLRPAQLLDASNVRPSVFGNRARDLRNTAQCPRSSLGILRQKQKSNRFCLIADCDRIAFAMQDGGNRTAHLRSGEDGRKAGKEGRAGHFLQSGWRSRNCEIAAISRDF